jgi:hypothetical protein
MAPDRGLVVAYVATWPIAGIVDSVLPTDNEIFTTSWIVHTLVLSVLLFAWCKTHASVRGMSPPPGAPLLVALIAPIGLPYYFFRAFQWRIALAALGKSVLVMILSLSLYFVTVYVGS